MENTDLKVKELYDSLDDNHKLIVDNHLEGFDWEVYEREIDWLNCGSDHDWEYRYRKGDSGRISLYSQCRICGKKHRSGLQKHNTVPNFLEKINTGEIKLYDIDLYEKVGANYNSYFKIKQIKHEKENKGQKKQWFIEHGEYLKTDKWKAIRIKVFTRDNYLCQCCLEAPATEVHHLSYAHWKDEWMHELMSVCYNCHHNKIHNK
jgi:5-methylcytosine-specific restriction endonuclease McrA